MSIDRSANPEREPWHVCVSEEEEEEIIPAAVLVAYGDEAWDPTLLGLEFCGFRF
jgi:hypothetical protein